MAEARLEDNGSLQPSIGYCSSSRVSVKQYAMQSGKCVHIPPPLLKRPW
jgi:hypothetical protein